MVIEAQTAFEKLIPETGKGKKAFEKRNDALRELSDKFVELQTASYHVLGKHPGLLEKPSVSNLSTIVFAKMVKDSSITRKILNAINKIFGQTIRKFFDPGTSWKSK